MRFWAVLASVGLGCRGGFRAKGLRCNGKYNPNILYVVSIFFSIIPIYMTGRIVLSHVHVSTLRGTWSTQKLIFTGLASGELSRWNKMKILQLLQAEGLLLVEESRGEGG